MSNGFKIGLAFIAGFGIGAFATKKYIDYKNSQCEYDEAVIEEVEPMDDKEDEVKVGLEMNKSFTNKQARYDYSKIRSTEDAEYKRILNDLRYQSEQEAKECLEELYDGNSYVKEERVDKNRPYYISQEEFEAIDSYESDEYTWFADGYVTDSYGVPISDEDIENSIGSEFEDYFEKYKADQIWVRNERLQMDFSIIRDLERFEVVAPPRIKRMVGLQ